MFRKGLALMASLEQLQAEYEHAQKRAHDIKVRMRAAEKAERARHLSARADCFAAVEDAFPGIPEDPKGAVEFLRSLVGTTEPEVAAPEQVKVPEAETPASAADVLLGADDE